MKKTHKKSVRAMAALLSTSLLVTAQVGTVFAAGDDGAPSVEVEASMDVQGAQVDTERGSWSYEGSGYLLNYSTVSDGIRIDSFDIKTEFSFDGDDSETRRILIIPSKINGKDVVELGRMAFSIPNKRTDLTEPLLSNGGYFTGELVIPNTVKRIDAEAFYNCFNLKSVGGNGVLTIPDSVTYIGDSAFYGCSGLTVKTAVELTDLTGVAGYTPFSDDPEYSYTKYEVGATPITLNSLVDYETSTAGDPAAWYWVNAGVHMYRANNVTSYPIDFAEITIDRNRAMVAAGVAVAVAAAAPPVTVNDLYVETIPGVKYPVLRYVYDNAAGNPCIQTDVLTVAVNGNVEYIGDSAFGGFVNAKNTLIAEVGGVGGPIVRDVAGNPVIGSYNYDVNGNVVRDAAGNPTFTAACDEVFYICQKDEVIFNTAAGTPAQLYATANRINGLIWREAPGAAAPTTSLFWDVSRFKPDWQYEYDAYVYRNGYMTGVGQVEDDSDVIAQGEDGARSGRIIFGRDDKITREQVAQVLYSFDGRQLVSLAPADASVAARFTALTDKGDNPISDWYYNPIQFVVHNKIATGTPSNTFGVGDNITREQFAVMLYEYAKYYNTELIDVLNIVGPVPAGTLGAQYVKDSDGDGTNDYRQIKLSYGIDDWENTLADYTDSDKVSPWASNALRWAVNSGVMSGKLDADGNPTLLDPKGFTTRSECAVMIKKLDGLRLQAAVFATK